MKSLPSVASWLIIGVLTIGVILSAGCSTSQSTVTSSKPVFDTSTTTLPAAQPAVSAQNTPFTQCNAGFTNCNGYCRDIKGDIGNCGSCGTVCSDNSSCKSGECQCKSGYSSCNGLCKDITSDPKNCGACNTICPTAQLCTDGVCGVSCTDGKTGCGNLCSDLKSDTKNCGACGIICPVGQVCNSGQCGVKCINNLIYCNGQCRDLSGDPLNCGSCGNVCPSTMICQSGTCMTSSGTMTTGQQSALQVLQLPSDQSCPTLQFKCGGTCVNLLEDNNNCGRCGISCRTGEKCSSARCIGTSSTCTDNGEKTCNGVCTNTFSDDSNCGSCYNTCTCPVSADPSIFCVPSCSIGKCYVGCTKVVSSGTGTVIAITYDSLMTDPNNCGACFNTCASGQTCVNGQCLSSSGQQSSSVQPRTCAIFGQTLCNGACVDLQTNSNNCGACGSTCTGTCVNGQCQSFAPTSRCPIGTTSCNGACVDTLTDNNNCGSCNTKCSSIQYCKNGGCVSSISSGLVKR